MLCSICKAKTATVHLTDIMGDKVRKTDLCEECAKNKGVDESTFMMVDLPTNEAAYTSVVLDGKNLPVLKAALAKALDEASAKSPMVFKRPSQN
jgi:protein-arginine kinase activator protein McsA